MARLLRRTGRRYLQRHPWQFVLAVGGVALGVAVAVSVALATASATRAFVLTNAALTGATTHQIVAGSGGLPEELYRHLRVDLGVRAAAPVVEGFVALAADPARSVRLLGIDPLAEGAIRRQFGASPATLDFPLAELLSEAGAVLASAGDERFALGRSVLILVNGRQVELHVVGIVRGAEERGLGDVLLADIATAQEVLGTIGRLSRIDLRLDGSDEDELVRRVRSALPATARLVTAQARADTTVQMTRAFELNLQAMSMLAMLCGLFLIYNTMTFSVVQRREQFGALRALGVTRAEILRMVLAEAALIGAVGTVLGLAGGVALGSGLVRLVTQTINDLYFVVAVRELALPPRTIVAGIVLGMGGTLLAALIPAAEATRASARLAMTRSVLEERAMRASPWLAAAGAAGVTVGFALARWSGGGLPEAFGGLLLIVIGAALMAPIAVRLVAELAAPLGRLAGAPGLMAARALTAGLSRTAVAVAALAIAVAVIVGVGVMVTSFRMTLVNWLGHTLQADLYVSAVSPRGQAATLPMDPSQLATIRALPGVLRTRSIRAVTLETDGGPTQLLVVQHDEPDREAYRLRDGNPDIAWQRFTEGAVLVSEPYAERRGIRVGDAVTLPTPAGAKEFAVAGIFYSYASDRGAVMMTRRAYDAWWNDAGISGLSIYLDSPDSLEAVAESTRNALQPALVTVISNRQLREQSLRVFDRTFLITGVLRILVTMVAFAGVLGAILALQLERAREHGMLRATGFTPAQLWQTVLWQSSLIGIAAAAIALPLGWLLAWVMIHVINKRSFGWTLQMTVPGEVLWQALAVAVGAALIAGIYPAARIARTPPAIVLREN